jgi:hypothetical protein
MGQVSIVPVIYFILAHCFRPAMAKEKKLETLILENNNDMKKLSKINT